MTVVEICDNLHFHKFFLTAIHLYGLNSIGYICVVQFPTICSHYLVIKVS